MGGLVFGTLLGPETTGPWPAGSLTGEPGGCGAGLFLVSWLHRSHGCSAPFGGGACVGCVVRGCCLRTT
jgi:hypothetical protein